jgi:hypothetical protein
MTNVPPEKSATRKSIRSICIVAAFFSAFFAAHGLMMTAQFFHDQIPAGRIESIVDHTKSGPRLHLDNGQEVVFPAIVLFKQPKPMQLVAGDQVSKQRGTFAYLVNGNPLTNIKWIMHYWLLPGRLVFTLGAYLLLGGIFVLKYQRTPLADLLPSDTDPKRPRKVRTLPMQLMILVVSWLVLVIIVTLLFSCVSGCLFAMGRLLALMSP